MVYPSLLHYAIDHAINIILSIITKWYRHIIFGFYLPILSTPLKAPAMQYRSYLGAINFYYYYPNIEL